MSFHYEIDYGGNNRWNCDDSDPSSFCLVDGSFEGGYSSSEFFKLPFSILVSFFLMLELRLNTGQRFKNGGVIIVHSK